MRMWSRGRLLETREVKKWPKEEQYEANKKEKECVFSNFSSTNKGKSRILVCHVNRDHPEFEQNIQMIIMSQQNYNNSNLYESMFKKQQQKTIVADRVLKIWRTLFMLLALTVIILLVLINA